MSLKSGCSDKYLIYRSEIEKRDRSDATDYTLNSTTQHSLELA